ncbi:hypothetical protein HDU99_005055 [Rhizoclosmatium hyalinum]|nr:hypothetical protein HDU99_005055 [Rhizoclosmatium hyalinum]
MQRKTKLREQLVAKRPTPVFDPIENYNKILSCPIDWTPFEDPVVAADEHTYERAPLTRWLFRGGQIFNPATSPVTGVRLTSRVMTSNEVIKKLSRAWNRRGIKDPTPELKKILTCPLSGKLFVNPVLCVDGYSYERDHIKKHYESFSGYPASPITKQPLYSKQIVRNITVLHAVKGLETLKGVDWSYDEPEKYNGSCMSMKEMSEVLDEYSGFDDDFFIN